MEFSWRYRDSLNGVFNYGGGYGTGNSLNRDVTFDNHNVLSRMLVVDISLDEIEVPMIAKAAIEHTVSEGFIHSNNVQKVVIPLYVNSYNQSRRTADSIINEFFSRTTFDTRLQKVTTNKGETYYGGRGIILDENFKPLILCSMMSKRVEVNSRIYMDYYKPIVRISPDVFINEPGLINKSSLISKHILKKVIPFYLTHNVESIQIYKSRFRNEIPENTKPQILIEDISRFIETPALPNPKTCSNEALNKLLLDNIDDVLNQIE